MLVYGIAEVQALAQVKALALKVIAKRIER